MPRAIVISLAIALLPGPWGCAHSPKTVSEEMRGQFGRIGIVSVPSTPKIQFHPEFAKGCFSGAGKGAGMGSVAGALAGLYFLGLGGGSLPSSCNREECVVILVIGAAVIAIGGVVGGVTGGIKGAVNAVPREEAQKIEVTIKTAFDGICIQKAMAASVFENSLELPNYVFVLLDEEGPIISKPCDFTWLNKVGIDTVLELNVKGCGFREGRGENPVIALFMKVHTRLIRTKDRNEIYSREFEYKSSKHPSADWFDMDARLLREEINNCFKELPRQIVEELFGRRPPIP
jgi:hypothetical protein